MNVGRRNSLVSDISNQEDSIGENASQHDDRDPEVGTSSPLTADRAPHNVNNMVLGTALLWIGWLGFNGGSALGGNLRAASACVSTHVAACAGGTTMLLLFWGSKHVDRFLKKKTKGIDDARNPSVTHFCDGVVIALVAITPGAGFVSTACPSTPGSLRETYINLGSRMEFCHFRHRLDHCRLLLQMVYGEMGI